MIMAVVAPSITQSGRYEPFELQVARGQITNHSLVNIQGYNAAQPTGFRAAWELSNSVAYVFPASAVEMTFSSSASEALTMTVFGLAADYSIKTATVMFSGGTSGTVTNGTATFFRINAMQVTYGTNAGNITATNGGVTYAQISTGSGRSQASIYTVPLGYTFFLIRAQAFSTNNGAQFCTYRVFSETIVNGVITANTVLNAPFTQSYMSTRIIPRPYPEKTDVQWQLSQSNPAPGSIQVEGVLIKNDGSL